MKALGMIEVYGYLSAVEALDSALKAANVNLLSVTKVRGGLVTVMVTGDVGAVKASMDASAAAASRVVIPRPASDIEKMLSSSSKLPQPPSDVPPPKRQEPVMSAKNEPLSVNEPEQMKQNVQPEQTDLDNADDMETVDLQSLTRENMADMKVVKLREIARVLNLKSMSKKEIRFAKKEELIERICEFQNRRDD